MPIVMVLPKPNSSRMLSAQSSNSSKLSSSSSPVKKSMADVANMFIRLRRTGEKIKSHHIDSSSGEPQTHPSLAGDGVTCGEKVDIELNENYVCSGAVDVVKLLRCSRTKLLEKASFWNANVLIHEQYVALDLNRPLFVSQVCVDGIVQYVDPSIVEMELSKFM